MVTDIGTLYMERCTESGEQKDKDEVDSEEMVGDGQKKRPNETQGKGRCQTSFVHFFQNRKQESTPPPSPFYSVIPKMSADL